MSKTLLAGSALALMLALAACSRQPRSGDDSATAPRAAPIQSEPAPTAKRDTETASFAGDGGAYGMPRAPIPYNQLQRYEQQQEGQDGQPGEDPDAAAARQHAYHEPAKQLNPKTRREADAVFY